MSKTVLFQVIQFSISTQSSSIWPIDRTLSSASTPGQSGPRSDSNEGVLHIPKKLQHCWNLTIRLFSVISTTLIGGILTPLQRCSRCFLQPQLTGQSLYINIILNVYDLLHIIQITFLNESDIIFFCTQLNSFKYCNLINNSIYL